jgi:hypothetical protein
VIVASVLVVALAIPVDGRSAASWLIDALEGAARRFSPFGWRVVRRRRGRHGGRKCSSNGKSVNGGCLRSRSCSAVAAFFGARTYLGDARENIERQWRNRYVGIPVTVAAADLPAGRVLAASDLARREKCLRPTCRAAPTRRAKRRRLSADDRCNRCGAVIRSCAVRSAVMPVRRWQRGCAAARVR